MAQERVILTYFLIFYLTVLIFTYSFNVLFYHAFMTYHFNVVL